MVETHRLGRPEKYPWSDWTDGTERILLESEDFDCTAESFVILVRRTARVKKLAVSVSRTTVDDGTPAVRVKFHVPKEQHAAAV
jgi:hypothetical protein